MKINPKKLEAKVHTLSNFMEMNDLFFPVLEIIGRRVTVINYDPELDRPVSIDFVINEIVEFRDV